MGSSRKFEARLRHLEDAVGTGNIVAGCYVNQPYAQDQHENRAYRHDVGRDHYLGGPLMENALPLVQRIANRVITSAGSDLEDAMVDTAEEMAGYVQDNAPLLYGPLKNSGEPYVVDDGVEIYRRPAASPRVEESPSGWHRQ